MCTTIRYFLIENVGVPRRRISRAPASVRGQRGKIISRYAQVRFGGGWAWNSKGSLLHLAYIAIQSPRYFLEYLDKPSGSSSLGFAGDLIKLLFDSTVEMVGF